MKKIWNSVFDYTNDNYYKVQYYLSNNNEIGAFIKKIPNSKDFII